jgi:serine/threonine protein phosphatase PrpC/LysM repeat protein
MSKHLIATYSHIGARAEQQDYFGTYELPNLGTLCIVSDGMGGRNGGALASERATKIIIQSLLEAQVMEPRAALENAIIFANQQIFDFSQRNSDYQGMGATLTAVLLHPQYAVASHVGDSRIYLFRRGQKIYRTNDHSKVFEQYVLQGTISEEEARLHPEKNKITRFLGMGPGIQIDTQVMPYVKGDRFVLCTDGIWEALPENYLMEWLVQRKPGNLVADALAQNILALNNPHQDNLTIAVIDVLSDSIIEPPLDMRTKTKFGVLAGFALLTIPLAIWVVTLLNQKSDLKAKVDELNAQISKEANEAAKQIAPSNSTAGTSASATTGSTNSGSGTSAPSGKQTTTTPASKTGGSTKAPEQTPAPKVKPLESAKPDSSAAPKPASKPNPDTSQQSNKQRTLTHVVQPKETLYGIAKRYHVSQEAIKKKILLS